MAFSAPTAGPPVEGQRSRWRRLLRSPSTMALAAGIAMAAGVLGATVWVAYSDRIETMQADLAKAELLARVLEDQTTRSFDAAMMAIETLSESPVVRAADRDPEKTSAVLAQALVVVPFLRAAVVVDAQGLVQASSLPQDEGLTLDLARLGPWQKDNQEYIGTFVPERGVAGIRKGSPRIQTPAGVGFIPVLRGFRSASGQPLMLLALLNPDSLSNLQQLAVGNDGFHSALTTYSGTLLSSSSGVQAPGTDLSAGEVFRNYLPQREHARFIGNGMEGTPEVVAYRVSRTRPLVVIVEQSLESTTRRWLEVVQGFIAVGVVAMVVVLGLTIAVWRSLRAREAAHRLADAAQKQIAKSEREMAVLMRSVQEVIFRTDAKGVITFVNARWDTLHGPRAADAVGRTLASSVDPRYQERVERLFDPAAGANVRTCQALVNVDEFTQQLFEVALVPLFVNDVIVGFAGSAVDVTERWLSDQRLQAELAFRNLLLEISPLPISMTDGQGAVSFVNKAWEAYKGRKRADVVGRPLEAVLPADEAAAHTQAEQQLRSQRGPAQQQFEMVVTCSGGSRRDTRVLKALVTDELGRVTGILTTLMDITDFREAERATREARDAAVEAARAKSEFIANMSHELRTPLQSIIGFSELGVLRGQKEPRLAAMFEDIHAAGGRMLALVNDLLDVAKLESSVGTFHLERIDLRGVARGVVRELEPLLAHRQLRIALDLAEQPMVAKADPLRFQQVVRNVLANAIKFAPQGSAIAFEGALDDSGDVHFIVRDQGPGIPPAELESIFEAFVQSSKTKDGSGGTGLGLAICRTIIEAMGGHIHAANAARGGAEFHIVLPARNAMETVPSQLLV